MRDMGELIVYRRWFSEKATEGEIFLDELFKCYCIEDKSRGLRSDMPTDELLRLKVYGETAIPTGRYKLKLYNSPKHGPDTIMLENVPVFDYIQIHPANRAEELLGCIAPGKDRTAPDDDWVGQSKAATDALRDKIIPRMKAGE